MRPEIVDFIQKNRGKYTREVIRQQLIDAGHDPADVDRAWAELARPDSGLEHPGGATPRASIGGMDIYVYVFYGLGLLAAVVIGIAIANVEPGYSIIFVAVYAVAGFLVARWLANRPGPQSGLGLVSMLIGVPILFVLLFGGSCLAGIPGLVF